MSYCLAGEKPKVYYKFGVNPYSIYQPNIAPIDVSMEDYSVNGANYSETGYTLTVYSTNNFQTFSYVVRNYQVVDKGAAYIFAERYELLVQTCASDSLVSLFNIDPSTIVISGATTCPTIKPDKRKAKLHVKKAGETADIFSIEGDYPGSFKVACEGCPEGTIKCECDSYPGYCCVSCSELKTNIAGITATVKTINQQGSVSYG